MPRKPESGHPLSLAERQKRFRQVQKEKKNTLEARVRSAQIRLDQYSNAEIGQQIAQMCERWHPEHQSVRDRVLLLARRLNML